MNKIVQKYAKIDLHIHTSASVKDGRVVSENTVANIREVLLPKLLENQVDMVALTDHNVFSIEHYNEMKKLEDAGCLKKVLPGVEFDVMKHNERFHVVVIFDDCDIDKIKLIPKIISNYNNFFKDGAYKFPYFVKILDDIKIPCVTIAHQKSDPKGNNHNQNLSVVGYENFINELYIDYFDSLEFAAADTEGFLKLRKVEEHIDNLRYITGTDCHRWSEYPVKDRNFNYTYIKALPTFMGLVMSLTELGRVDLDGGNINSPVLDKIEYVQNGVTKHIELSSGINVIIGDNSIGKSAILEELFSDKIASHHREYLKRRELTFSSLKHLEAKVLYNSQGEIRKKFAKSGMKLEDDKAIKDFFPKSNTTKYKNTIKNRVSLLVDYFKYNELVMKKKELLDTTLSVPFNSVESYYPNFIRIKEVDDLTEINTKIEYLQLALDNISKLIECEKEIHIKERLEHTHKELTAVSSFYKEQKRICNIKLLIRNKFNKTTDDMATYTNKLKTDAASTKDDFETNSENVILALCEYLKIKSKKINLPNIDVITQEDSINLSGNYKFCSTVIQNHFSQESFEEMVLDIFDGNKIKSYKDLEDMELCNLHLKGFLTRGAEKSIEVYFKENINNYLNEKVLKKHSYIQMENEMIDSKGYSAGKNALIYLDIVKDSNNVKLLVFDQPEDDVSQNKISTELTDILNIARRNKQIIFITHNPQLVVNLDVDNVIILELDEKNEIDIKYGALEYENHDIKILDKVATLLDGGKEVLRKRWRRYGKQNG